jgi:Transposase IS66 family
MALEALTRIGQLYPIEQQGKALSIDVRQQLRVEQSQPALNALHEWPIQTESKPLTAAIPQKRWIIP